MSNMSNPTAPSDNETSLRKQIFDYAISQADGPYKEFIPLLSQAWQEFNDRYFDGSLTPAFIAITAPKVSKAYADCSLWSSYGGKHQIRIKETVIEGTHNDFNPNHAIENRLLFILDVLLHEQIHQFLFEIKEDYSKAHKRHGGNYPVIANQIGDQLGLPHVFERTRKDKSLPIASQWPMCVRPAGYYGDLLKEQAQDEPEEPEDEPEPEPDFLALAIEAYRSLEAALSKLVPEQYDAFFEATGYPMPSIVTVNDDKVDRPVEPEPEPVETKPVTKPRKVKKSKSSSPVGCLSQIEVVKAIKVSFSEFKNLLEQNLFPQPDMSDKNTGTGYWSDFVVENWLKNNPKS